MGAAHHEPRPAVDRAPDDAVDPLELLLVDDRPQVDLLAVGVAEPEARRLLGQQRHVVPGHAAVDDVASGREADLALELERSEGAGRGGGFEVGIVEDDQGVVAAELEADALEQPTGQLAHPPTRRRRPGEEDARDVGIGDDGLADVGPADDDLENALGQPGLAEDDLEHRATGDRCLRIGLEDDGVAKRQRGRHDPHPEHARRVPGRDRPDDPDRHPPEHREPPGHDRWHQRAVRLIWHRRRGIELADREVLLVVHLVVDRARLSLGPRGELRAMGLVDVGRAAEDARPILVIRLRPGRLGGRRRGGGAGDVVGRRARVRQQVAAGGRLAGLVRGARARAPFRQQRIEPAACASLVRRVRCPGDHGLLLRWHWRCR